MNRASRYWLDLQEAKAAIERVLRLHVQDSEGKCRHCLFAYPCRTVELLVAKEP